MPTQTLKARHGIPLRLDSGALTVADRPLPLFDLDGHRRAIIHIMIEANLITPDADDRVRFHVETAYGAQDFAASGELLDEATGIDDTQTAFTVDDTTTFVVGDVIRMETERMLVTATDGAAPGVLTVTRGFDNDPRATHANNVAIDLQDVDWVEVAQITYDIADDGTTPEAIIVIGSIDISPVILDDVDEALGDNTILAAPLGDRLRLRASVAGATAPTYRYSARASLQN